MVKKLRVTLVKSPIGQSVYIKQTASALGLLRMNSTIDHPDNSSIRGMLFKVRHLVRVEEIES